MQTVKSSADISRMFAEGKRKSNPYLSCIVCKRVDRNTNEESSQHDLTGRVAFIAGKKNGNAVWRNSAKRRMRAICHELGGPWDGWDVAFVAKSRINEVSYQEVFNASGDTLKKLHLSKG